MTRFYLGLVSYLFISLVLWLPRRTSAISTRLMAKLLERLNLTPTQFVWLVLIASAVILPLGAYVRLTISYEPRHLKLSAPLICKGEQPTYILTDAYFGCPDGGYFTCPHGLETCEVEYRSRIFKGETHPEHLPTRRLMLNGGDECVITVNEVFRIKRQKYHNDHDPTLLEIAEQK